MIKTASTLTVPIVPPVPISPLFPETDVSLTPFTVANIAVPLFDTTTTDINTILRRCPRVLPVIVGDDIRKSGDLVQVSATEGFSSDCFSLDISEPTMLFRYDDFVKVHNYHSKPFYDAFILSSVASGLFFNLYYLIAHMLIT